jgi:uncharacterized membrane protein YesL
MHFKLAGLLFLLVGGYFAVDAIILAEKQHSDAITSQVYPLVAIFLVMTVRVLQAEKHHREQQRETERVAQSASGPEALSST